MTTVRLSTTPKASTAALSPFSQKLLLPSDAFRAPRLAAKTEKGIEAEGSCVARKVAMKTWTAVPSDTRIRSIARNLCRRIMATALLAVCVFVVPAIASVTRTRLDRVRVPRIDSRAIENLQRWANDEKDHLGR